MRNANEPELPTGGPVTVHPVAGVATPRVAAGPPGGGIR